MRNLFIILTMIFATIFVSCKSEEKEMVEQHEIEARASENLQINFETFKEVKRIGSNEAIIFSEGELFYTTAEETRKLTLQDALNEISLDPDPYHTNGNVEGSIFRATFKVVRDTATLIEKYYFVDDDNNVIIEINE